MRSSTLIRAYQRARLLRNVTLVVFAALVAAALLWAMPWVPWGLNTGDYDSRTAIALALAFAACMSAFGFFYLRDKSNRYEQTLVTWSSVHDELGDLRRRDYFYERTSIECMRAERTGASFAVFAVHFGPSDSINSAETATALEALAGLIRQTDSLAALGPQEVGVVAAGMGAREAPAFAYRLKRAVELATGNLDGDQVSVGWAIWTADSTDSGELVGLARSRMQRKASLRNWAREAETGDEKPSEAANAVTAPSEPAPEKYLRIIEATSTEEREDEPAA